MEKEEHQLCIIRNYMVTKAPSLSYMVILMKLRLQLNQAVHY